MKIKSYNSTESDRIISLNHIHAKRDELRKRKLRVVVTNGCFDLLHVGHLRYLSAARSLGDVLWVGLNSDASVQQLKGPSRPINHEGERAELLAGLRCVDFVSIFEDVRATKFLQMVEPDIYAKGGDYEVTTLNPNERSVLESVGAEIQILPLVPGKSTSQLVERMARE